MNIESINLNCRRPGHFGASATRLNPEDSVNPENSKSGKKRYKHFEQMDDDTLMLRSTIKAHKEVEQGNKMKLYKAMPEIAAGIVGTTIAITQPGKLSSKIAAGAGFLVAAKIVESVSKKTDELVERNWNRENNTPKSNVEKGIVEAGLTLAGASAIAAIACISGKAAINSIANSSGKIAAALKNDASKLVSEINNSKLGRFVSKNVIPFEESHAKGMNIAKIAAPLAAIAGFTGIQTKLLNSLSKDIHDKASSNFIKGKLIQLKARDEFDKTDAVEV